MHNNKMLGKLREIVCPQNRYETLKNFSDGEKSVFF